MTNELLIIILVLLFIIICYNKEFEPLREEVEEYRKENDILNKEIKLDGDIDLTGEVRQYNKKGKKK